MEQNNTDPLGSVSNHEIMYRCENALHYPWILIRATSTRPLATFNSDVRRAWMEKNKDTEVKFLRWFPADTDRNTRRAIVGLGEHECLVWPKNVTIKFSALVPCNKRPLYQFDPIFGILWTSGKLNKQEHLRIFLGNLRQSKKMFGNVRVAFGQSSISCYIYMKYLLSSPYEHLPLVGAPDPSLAVCPAASVSSSAFSLANSAATRDVR